jgi:cytochrome c biogenesis protein CcdA
MLGLTLLVASIALADSINPSTLIPALWLARGRRARVLVSYTAGVFTVYLVGGLVLLLGPGQLLISSLHHIHGPLEHALQAAGGILALAFGLVSWRLRVEPASARPPGRLRKPLGAFALGAAIMAVELPTAFMYFGAISAVLAARPPAPAEIVLMIAYNAVFVAPLVALALIRRYAGASAERWLIAANARMRYVGQVALAGVAGVFGVALTAIGVNGLLTA